ncbi:MAG: glycosyltransferase family 2 protein [Bacteroidales bacterium]|nr:glycosyltransferase family 2 protein [Bacteroidales bacterium]
MSHPNGISIIMCCYNSKPLLEQTMLHLATVNLPEVWPVELIIVDNASTDDTQKLAASHWKNAGEPFPLEIHNEPKQGLIYARQRGLDVSHFEFILFVDDDNWIAADYLTRLHQLFTKHPTVAAFGGLNTPVFESEKPFWFDTFQRSYAAGRLADGFDEPREIGLFGAGLSIRRTALNELHQADFKSMLVGRTGKALSSGEDYELCKALKLAGWQIIFAPTLNLKHFITARRLNWEYFGKLNRGISQSIIVFLAYEYWIEIHRGANPFWTAIKYSWLFLLIKKGVKSWLLKMSLIINPELSKEASAVLIDYERTKVVVNHLLYNRKKYIELKKGIKNATWRKR